MKQMAQEPAAIAAAVVATIDRTGGNYYAVVMGERRRIYYVCTSGSMFAKFDGDEDRMRLVAGIYGDDADAEMIAEDIEELLREAESDHRNQ